MLKKLVFMGALLLISSAVYAAKPDGGGYDSAKVDWEEWDGNASIKAESWNWPAEYKYQAVCKIPVKMDIGFWIRVVGCKDCELKLHQDAIRKYSGSIDLQIVCNVNIQLAADWVKASGMPTINKDWCTVTPSSLDAPGGTVTVSLGLKDVDLSGFQSGQVGTGIEVGSVILKVRPNVTPALAGA
jgi:hypothetical protein